jgi:REP element-mobilizing transposase RayT
MPAMEDTECDLAWERFRRRNLPHWEKAGATYFVTFRLNGSLPAQVAEQWRNEYRNLRQQERCGALDGPATQRERRVLHRKFDDQLDRAHFGPKHLADPSVAQIVVGSLLHFAGSRYELPAFVVMPNHVHLLLQPLYREEDRQPWGLDEVMHSVKGFSANAANRVLKRSGVFWQREYYDHLVRDERELDFYWEYVVNNPVTAGLVTEPHEWAWSSVSALPEASF